jgi:hypothetical protein
VPLVQETNYTHSPKTETIVKQLESTLSDNVDLTFDEHTRSHHVEPSKITANRDILSTMLKEYHEDDKRMSPNRNASKSKQKEHLSPYATFNSPREETSSQMISLLTFQKPITNLPAIHHALSTHSVTKTKL